MNIDTLSIASARKALDAKEYSARELAEAHLNAIEHTNPELNAYLEVFDDVRAQADHADEVLRRGEQKALTGIPLAMKDNILIQGKRVSAASKILENYVAPYDATVTKKLKAQHAIFLGRTNLDEFAMGSSTENSAFGRTKHPLDPSRIPGGSSGGSAAAVKGGLALGAFGSDTGGSVRQPASLCGLVGLKPTYGTISRYGLIAFGSSLDQIGPLTRTVEDARILYDATRGADPNDSTSVPDSFFDKRSHKKKIGVPRDLLVAGVDPDVLQLFEQQLKKLEEVGYELVDVKLPSFTFGLAAYYIVNPAEASANLARFDGIRYGLSEDGGDITDVYFKTRGKGFGKEVRRRILIGTYVLSAGYVDAYYRKAEQLRDVMRAELATVLENVDAVAMPTSPTPAFKAGEKEDPLAMYAADIFTVPVNLTGAPGLSVPCGSVVRDSVNLPVGFQLVGAHGGEEMLFVIAEQVENTR